MSRVYSVTHVDVRQTSGISRQGHRSVKKPASHITGIFMVKVQLLKLCFPLMSYYCQRQR